MNLNEAQQKVVDHKKGPLLVVAGAGTGKTRVVVEKISALLKSGVRPHEILALTFTEKAASEMLDRILESETGLLLDMPIMTFNGYGDSLLKEFGVYMGLSRSFTLLGEQAKIVFVRERIDAFELGDFLPLTASPDGIIEDLLRHISRLKQQHIRPEEYEEAAQSLPEGDEAEKDYKKQQLILAGIYRTYESLTRQENVIDYDDQIYLALELLKSRPSVRAKLQQRYHTIFVDEFQDTNPMQSELIDLLVGEKQNLVVVGDDDQSIYGFRGATIANILDFKKRYPEAHEIALTENYRSGQQILDISYNLITNNNPHRLEASLGIDKKLTSKLPGDAPRLLRFSDKEAELNWLAKDIKKQLDSNTPGSPISLAVLTRSNGAAQAVHQTLNANDIPHRVVGLSSDLYETPIVRSLLELIRTIAEPDNNLSLHHTLIGPIFNIPNNLIVGLTAKAKSKHESLLEYCRDLTEQDDLKLALNVLENARDASYKPVGNVVYQILDESGYKDRLLEKSMDDESAEVSILHLGQFFSSLKEFEKIAIQPSLQQYLSSLPALKAAGENIDDTLDISEDEVIVTTIHKAKGLEWDSVYVPKMTNRSFPMRQNKAGFDIPETLTSESASPASEHLAEERRVMYVAATRARKNLTFSFVGKEKDEGKKSDASPFINEMFGEGIAERLPITDSVSKVIALEPSSETDHSVQLPREIFDGEAVHLSVTQAQSLLSCPLNFKYKFILKTPEPPTTSTGYGTQLHGYFEEINKRGKDTDDGELRSLDTMLQELEVNFDLSGYASKKQQTQALSRAKTTLRRFYETSLANKPASLVEEEFQLHLENNIILKGKMDAVFGEGSEAVIIDYKTGDRVKDGAKAKAAASKSQQLTMYAMAWQKISGSLPKKVALIYPDTEQVGEVSKRQQSIDSLEDKLQNLVAEIRQGVFRPGANHDYCIHPKIELDEKY